MKLLYRGESYLINLWKKCWEVLSYNSFSKIFYAILKADFVVLISLYSQPVDWSSSKFQSLEFLTMLFYKDQEKKF